MFRRILIISLLFFQFLMSQTFEVTLSDNVIGLNDSFEITFVLNDKGSSFTPPSFSEDFYVLSGPSRSSSTRIINGSMSQESSYKYVLRPKKVGVFTILPANIKVKGKTIGTRPITIQVNKASKSKQSNTPYGIASKKIHLDVRSTKTTCFIGEPIVLTYTIYFNLNIANLNPKKIEYNGFWTESIDVKTNTKQSSYNGQPYNSAVIKQIVLIPQTKGRQAIPPLDVDLVASIPTDRRDFFGLPTTQNIDFNVVSNSISINVLDVPESGKPKDFSGAVGQFDLDVILSKDSINVNESTSLKIIVSGKGNLNLLTTPQIDLNNDLEVYDPKSQDLIRVNQKGISGKKIEEYLIVPRFKGDYYIDPVEFSFFDTKKKQYVTLRVDEINLNVSSSKFSSDDSSFQSNFQKEQIDVINDDIKFIKTKYKNQNLKYKFHKSTLFIILLILPLVFVFFVILIKLDIITLDGLFPLDLIKEVSNRLELSKTLLKEKEIDQFYTSLIEVLFYYLQNKLNMKKGELTADNISQRLLSNGVDKSYVKEYLKLLDSLQSYKYSQNKNISTNSKSLINDLKILINKIDKQL